MQYRWPWSCVAAALLVSVAGVVAPPSGPMDDEAESEPLEGKDASEDPGAEDLAAQRDDLKAQLATKNSEFLAQHSRADRLEKQVRSLKAGLKAERKKEHELAVCLEQAQGVLRRLSSDAAAAVGTAASGIGLIARDDAGDTVDPSHATKLRQTNSKVEAQRKVTVGVAHIVPAGKTPEVVLVQTQPSEQPSGRGDVGAPPSNATRRLRHRTSKLKKAHKKVAAGVVHTARAGKAHAKVDSGIAKVHAKVASGHTRVARVETQKVVVPWVVALFSGVPALEAVAPKAAKFDATGSDVPAVKQRKVGSVLRRRLLEEDEGDQDVALFPTNLLLSSEQLGDLLAEGVDGAEPVEPEAEVVATSALAGISANIGADFDDLQEQLSSEASA